MKDLKPTAQTIRNDYEYEIAVANLEELKSRLVKLLIEQGQYSDDEWQDKILEMERMKELQAQLIENYIKEKQNPSLKYLGGNIKFLLKKADMKVSDLEGKIGVSAGYLSRALNEDSKKRISIDVVWKIARIFNVNIDDLINVNMSAPTKDIQTVVEFIKKLRLETDAGDIRWKSYGRKPTEVTAQLFDARSWSDEEKGATYGPRGYEGETAGFVLRGDVFGCYLNYRLLLVVPVTNLFPGRNGVEFYTYFSCEGYGDTEEFERICCTLDDDTDTLNEKGEQLLKTIKLHESDFVMSSSAKSYIESYLNPVESDEELPFT